MNKYFFIDDLLKTYPLIEIDGWKCVLLGNLFVKNKEVLIKDIINRRYHELKNLDGNFFLILYNSKENEIITISDKFGMIPIFYFIQDKKVCFYDEFKYVFDSFPHKKTINEQVLFQFFSCNYVINKESFINGIDVYPSATLLRIHDNKIKETYKYYNYDFVNENISYEDALNTIYEYFIEGLERYTENIDEIGVLLSGGLDSRLICAGLNKIGKKAKTFTFGINHCRDVEYAKVVASKLGFSNKHYLLNSSFIFDYIDNVIKEFGSNLSIIHSQGIHIYEDIAKDVDIVLSGYLGDVVLGGTYLLNNDNDLISFEKVFQMAGYCFQEKYFNVNYSKKYVRFFKDFLSQIYYQYKHIHQDYWNMKYLVDRRGANFISLGTHLLRKKVVSSNPFFFSKFVDFLSRLPSTYIRGHRIYFDVIKKYFPEIKSIAIQSTGKSVLGKKNNDKYISNFQDYENWFRNDLKYIVEKKMKDSPVYNYLDKNFVQSILSCHFSNQRNYSIRISNIITFDCFLRNFF